MIVGAGVSGASVAYWLTKEDPHLEIAVLEKGTLASGATGRNAGFITCGSVEHFNRLVVKHGHEEAEAIWRFSEANLQRLMEEIIPGEESALGFQRNGSFSLASTESEFSELKETAQLMDSLSIDVEVVEQSGIEKRVGAKGFVGGIKYKGDASVNPVALTKKIFLKSQGSIFENTEVSRVERGTGGCGGVREIYTNKGLFEAPVVVYATNGYSPNLHVFFKGKIFPTRGQILLMEPVKEFMESPCYANFVLDYFRQLPTGHLLIGGFRQLEIETEVGYSDHITDLIQNTLQEFVQTHLPQFRDKRVQHRWAGVMGFSVDGQPLVGSLPEDSQTFFSCAFTAHGLGLAFQSGKALVDVMYGRKIPDFLSARRFSGS